MTSIIPLIILLVISLYMLKKRFLRAKVKKNHKHSLKESKVNLIFIYKEYRKKRKKLSSNEKTQLKEEMMLLQDAILNQDEEETIRLNDKLHNTYLNTLKKKRSSFVSSAATLVLCLIAAIVIRQTCFELYEIPSGSMRPTFKELDKLVVTKSQFGLNIPLLPHHLLFEKDEVKRMGIITFTGENLVPGS